MIRSILSLLLAGSLVSSIYAQTVEVGARAFDFTLFDTLGQKVALKDFEGKNLVAEVWYTGCSGCASFYKKKLSLIEKELRHRDDIVFLSISLDKDSTVWKNSIKEGIYTSKHAVNLNSGKIGSKHPLIAFYNMKVVPHMHLIDATGKIGDIISRPSKCTVEELIARIEAVF